MTAQVVYLLCALTSVACAVLLVRSYLAARTPLLLWSSLCFVGLALNNSALFLDSVITLPAGFVIFRTAVALAGVGLLLYGLIWEVH
jgi:hypothetical protein